MIIYNTGCMHVYIDNIYKAYCVIQEYSNAYSTTTVLLLLHGHFGYHVLSYLKPHCTHRTFLPAPSTFNLHSQSIYTFATSEKPAAFWD